MLKKLMDGEFSLTDTFWKFGVLGLIVSVFIIRFFGSLLAHKLAGVSLWVYFTRYFHPFHMNTSLLLLIVCYYVLTKVGLFPFLTNEPTM